MKLIAHRGVPSLATENTLQSILTATRYHPELIEFDVHATRDKQLIVMHDNDLKRMCDDPRFIRDLTYEDIKKIRNNKGQPIPSAREALSACGSVTAAIEGKGADWSLPLSNLIKEHFGTPPIVISGNYGELQAFHRLSPSTETYLINKHNPLKVVYLASRGQFMGIGVVYWCMNPLLYWIARRKSLKIVIYTVPPIITRLMSRLYPKAMLATNYIQKFRRQT